MTTILVFTTTLNLSFWILFSMILSAHRNKTKKQPKCPVSVLICAKNEENNIRENIDDLYLQSAYSEIVYIDDFSTDGTLAYLTSISKTKPKTKVYPAALDINGKKAALMHGFSLSKAPFVLCTDADCKPISNLWVESMYTQSEEKNIVLGYGPYLKVSGFLNAWIRFETFFIAIQYLSLAVIGQGFMSIGRNVLYPKTYLQDISLDDLSPEIASGDDDLLFQKVHTGSNTTINLDPNSFMYSKAKETWASYFNQKSRHLSSAKMYDFSKTWMLHLFTASHILLFTTILIFIGLGDWSYVINLLIVRWIILYVWLYPLTKKLDIRDLWKWIPLFDILLYFFYFIFAALSLFSKNKDFESNRNPI